MHLHFLQLSNPACGNLDTVTRLVACDFRPICSSRASNSDLVHSHIQSRLQRSQASMRSHVRARCHARKWPTLLSTWETSHDIPKFKHQRTLQVAAIVLTALLTGYTFIVGRVNKPSWHSFDRTPTLNEGAIETGMLRALSNKGNDVTRSAWNRPPHRFGRHINCVEY
jgi:hypothetical protein